MARDAATASVRRLYGPQSNLLPQLGNLDWHTLRWASGAP